MTTVIFVEKMLGQSEVTLNIRHWKMLCLCLIRVFISASYSRLKQAIDVQIRTHNTYMHAWINRYILTFLIFGL